MDWATLLVIIVFVLGGWTLYAIGYHRGFKNGEEAERDATAKRFHQFRLKKFSGRYDE